MSPEVKAVLLCAVLAIVTAIIALALPDKDAARPVFRIPLPFWKHGMTVMEEEVTERRFIVWYGAGLPKLEWLRVHS